MAIKAVDIDRVIKCISIRDDSIDFEAMEYDEEDGDKPDDEDEAKAWDGVREKRLRAKTRSYLNEYNEPAVKRHLILNGEPTWFTRGPLSDKARARLMDAHVRRESVEGEDGKKELEIVYDEYELMLDAFRYGVRNIENGPSEFKRTAVHGLKTVSEPVMKAIPYLTKIEVGTRIWQDFGEVTDDEKKEQSS